MTQQDPCFNTGTKLPGLSRGDAVFVDVIHTNPGALGQEKQVGDIDTYAGGLPLQPGCFSIVCSHTRSCYIYAESVYPGQENNFQATECASMYALKSNLCRNPSISIGYNVPKTAKGKYFMETNAKSPYGNNAIPYLEPMCV